MQRARASSFVIETRSAPASFVATLRDSLVPKLNLGTHRSSRSLHSSFPQGLSLSNGVIRHFHPSHVTGHMSLADNGSCIAQGDCAGLGIQQPNPKMKTMKFTQVAFVAAALAFALPARADTMSVPTKEAAAYTADVPASWKPKADTADESVEATAPDNHAYLSAWISKSSEPKAKENFIKDLDATLKDSLKSIDDGVKEESSEANGVKMTVLKGSGVDKRAGNKVKFQVAMFSAGADQVGIVYIDYDNDAPKDIMDAIQGIMKSIKVVKKK
jgi:hypothetical protein